MTGPMRALFRLHRMCVQTTVAKCSPSAAATLRAKEVTSAGTAPRGPIVAKEADGDTTLSVFLGQWPTWVSASAGRVEPDSAHAGVAARLPGSTGSVVAASLACYLALGLRSCAWAGAATDFERPSLWLRLLVSYTPVGLKKRRDFCESRVPCMLIAALSLASNVLYGSAPNS